MSLSKVGSGASYDNAGIPWTSVNLTKDTGTAVGDLAIITANYYEFGDNDPVTTPSGFTAHGSNVISGSGDTETRFDVFTRVIDGTEGASFGVTLGGAQFAITQLLTVRGDEALSVVSVTPGTPASADTSVDAPSVTLASTEGIVALYGLGDSGGTYTPPSGMTLGISEPTEDTNASRAYYESPAAGSTGIRTLSWTNTRDAIGVMLVIDGANTGGAANEGDVATKAARTTPVRRATARAMPRFAWMPLDVGPKVPTPFAPARLERPILRRDTSFSLIALPTHLEYPAPEAPVTVQYVPLLAQRNIRHTGRH